jgi:drug/metabolite transporter (DMT)-like permease
VTGGRSITVASEVLAAVLGAALLHALWNSLVKSAGDRFLTSARVCLWCGVIALATGCALPSPNFAAAGFIVASAIIHVVYFVLVGRLYRNADLSVAYPLMRGLAPLIACVIAALTLAEVPKPLTLAGVVILVAGVVTMGVSGLAQGRIDRATIAVALANSAIIAVYTVVDGEGARLAGADAAHAFAYNAWADAFTAALYAPLLFAYRGVGFARDLIRDIPRSAFGGVAAFGGYALVVWAMTQTTIGAVAALRESSVVFAALIGVVFLGEPFRGARAGAAVLIMAGVVALRLG